MNLPDRRISKEIGSLPLTLLETTYHHRKDRWFEQLDKAPSEWKEEQLPKLDACT